MIVKVRGGTLGDFNTILEQLSKQSSYDIEVIGGKEEGRAYVSSSEKVWTILIDEEIVCMVGIQVGSLLGDSAYVWMIATDTAKKFPFLFLRYAQMLIEELSREYSNLHGMVKVSNARNRVWMEWLGFKVESRTDQHIYFAKRG